jgi:hypothetical protein
MGNIGHMPGFQHFAGAPDATSLEGHCQLNCWGYLTGDPWVNIGARANTGYNQVRHEVARLRRRALRSIHCALRRIYGRGQGEVLNKHWSFAGESLPSVLYGILGGCNKEALHGRMQVLGRPVRRNKHQLWGVQVKEFPPISVRYGQPMSMAQP